MKDVCWYDMHVMKDMYCIHNSIYYTLWSTPRCAIQFYISKLWVLLILLLSYE